MLQKSHSPHRWIFWRYVCCIEYSKMGLWYDFLCLFICPSTLNKVFSFHDLLLQDRYNLHIWVFSSLNCEALSFVFSSQCWILLKSHRFHRWYFWRFYASWNIQRWGCVIISCDSLFTLQHSTMYSLFMIFCCRIGTIFTSECFLSP